MKNTLVIAGLLLLASSCVAHLILDEADLDQEGWADVIGLDDDQYEYLDTQDAETEERAFDSFEVLKTNHDVNPHAYVRSLFLGPEKVSRSLYGRVLQRNGRNVKRHFRNLQEEGEPGAEPEAQPQAQPQAQPAPNTLGAINSLIGANKQQINGLPDDNLIRAAGAAAGVPVDPAQVKQALQTVAAAIPTPKRPSVINYDGFKLRGVQGMNYQMPKESRMDKNLDAFMGIVTKSCDAAVKKAGIDFNNLKTREDGDKAFTILDEAVYNNPFAAASFHNEETNRRLSKESTDAFKIDGKPTAAQREEIANALKEMVNDDEIWKAFSAPGNGASDKIDRINEAYSQTGARVKDIGSFFKGSDSMRVHVADLAYIKFPNTVDPKSRLKMYYISVDAWFASERILFVEKNKAGLDFHMRKSEYMVDNERLLELDPYTKEKATKFVDSLFSDNADEYDDEGEEEEELYEDEFEDSEPDYHARVLTAVCELGCDRIKEAPKKDACKKSCKVDDENLADCSKQCKGKDVDCVRKCLNSKKPKELIIKPKPPPQKAPVMTVGPNPKLAKPLPKATGKENAKPVGKTPAKGKTKAGTKGKVEPVGKTPAKGKTKAGIKGGKPATKGGKPSGKPAFTGKTKGGPKKGKPAAPKLPKKSAPERTMSSYEEEIDDEDEYY